MHVSFRNLLQPSGVMLRPAVFSLKVYRAEDIPQSKYCFMNIVNDLLLDYVYCHKIEKYN